jgi:hypothetical protein
MRIMGVVSVELVTIRAYADRDDRRWSRARRDP